MSKVFNLYRNILFAFAVIFIAITCLPIPFKVQPFVVLSSSMEPSIHVGAVCYVNKNVKGDEVNAGDVIAFNIGGTTVVHRVNAINEETGSFITKGDNNEVVDLSEVTPDMVKGKVIWSMPYLGYVIKWIKSSKGLVFCGAAILISIVSSIIYSDSEKKLTGGSLNEENEKKD